MYENSNGQHSFEDVTDNNEIRNAEETIRNESPKSKRIRLQGGAGRKDGPLELIRQAIKNAKAHGINLNQGRLNKSDGNCAFDSVIYNINDRPCFKEKLHLESFVYRQIWVTELEDVSKKYPMLGTGYTAEEKKEHWNCLKHSGVYEVDFFGDFVLYAIAMGCHKDILIFNTSTNAYDPIYVIRANKFGGYTDTNIPVVVGYNGVHYESLHPFSEKDTEKTKTLVKSFTDGSYSFDKKDYHHNISSSDIKYIKVKNETVKDTEDGDKKTKDKEAYNWEAEGIKLGKDEQLIDQKLNCDEKPKNEKSKDNEIEEMEDKDKEVKNTEDADKQTKDKEAYKWESEAIKLGKNEQLIDEKLNCDEKPKNEKSKVNEPEEMEDKDKEVRDKEAQEGKSPNKEKKNSERIIKKAPQTVTDIAQREIKVCSHFLPILKNKFGKLHVIGAPKMNTSIGEIIMRKGKKYIKILDARDSFKSCDFYCNKIKSYEKSMPGNPNNAPVIPGLSRHAKIKKCYDRNLTLLSPNNDNEHCVRPSFTHISEYPEGMPGECYNLQKYEGRFRKQKYTKGQREPVRTRVIKSRKLLANKKKKAYIQRMKKNNERERLKFKPTTNSKKASKFKVKDSKICKSKAKKNFHKKQADTGNDKPKNNLSEDMKNQILNRIRYLEVKLAIENTANMILRNEEDKRNEVLNKLLEQYRGRGTVLKNSNDASLNVGVTGVCSIDSLLNLFRNTDFKAMDNHSKCHHRLKCALCIVRSALIKIDTLKRKCVKLPEIENNIGIFLGKFYCPSCYLPNGQAKNHRCPIIKPAEIGLKDILDNFLQQPNVPTNFCLKFQCDTCCEDLTPYDEGYFKMSKQVCQDGKLSSGIFETLKEIKKSHVRSSERCINSKVYMRNIPNNFLCLMEPGTVTHFERKISIGSEHLYYTGQVNYKTGVLSDHFSTTLQTTERQFVKYSGKNSKIKEMPNVSKSVLMLYTKERTGIPNKELVYSRSALEYFA